MPQTTPTTPATGILALLALHLSKLQLGNCNWLLNTCHLWENVSFIKTGYGSVLFTAVTLAPNFAICAYWTVNKYFLKGSESVAYRSTLIRWAIYLDFS